MEMPLIREGASLPLYRMLHVWAEKPQTYVKFMRTQSDNEGRQVETSGCLSMHKTSPWRGGRETF